MNYKSIILFFLVFLFPSIYISKDNVQYKCADDLKIDTCYLSSEVESQDKTEYTYYLKGCSKKKKCVEVPTINSKGLYQCAKVKEYREDGDSCKVNEECQSGLCSNEKCTYIADGQECEDSRSCNKNSRCKWNSDDKGECTALISEGKECESTDDCAFGLLCNTAVTPSNCTKMFSLEDGKDSSEDFLCKNGRQYNNKCVTTKTVNSTCSEETDMCQISYTENESEKNVDIECKSVSLSGGEYDDREYFCPLQSDSNLLKEYIEEYTKQRDKMKQKDIDKIHVGKMEEIERYTLNGHKKVLKAYVNLEYYKIIGDDDCIRDYFITQEKANKNKLSTIFLSLLLLLII